LAALVGVIVLTQVGQLGEVLENHG
jgi:hypothetical protein